MQNDNVSITGIKGMLHNFKASFEGHPISLQEIRNTLNEVETTEIDFIDLLEKHHNYLEESISVLTDKEASSSEKQAHLNRFIQLLKMHGRAEEETLFNNLPNANKKFVIYETAAHESLCKKENEKWKNEIAAFLK